MRLQAIRLGCETVRHSRLVVLWGANVLEARLGTELGPAIAGAARSGTPVVVIDPRRTMTAKALGARWIPIRPGTDAAMMLAVLNVLFGEGLIDMAGASSLATGLDELERYVSGSLDGVARSPAWAEDICGVPADGRSPGSPANTPRRGRRCSCPATRYSACSTARRPSASRSPSR